MGRLPAVTPSLSGPPDTDPGAPPRRRRRRRPPPYRSGRLDFEPAPLSIERHQAEDSKVFPVKKRHLPEFGTFIAAVVALGTIALVGTLVYRGTRVHVEVKGISNGAALTPVKAAGLQ